MPPLEEWLRTGPALDAIYQAELGRSVYSDPEAFCNWAFHRLQEGQSFEWIRDRIRESSEWAARHGAPPPSPGVPPSRSPVPGGLRLHAADTSVRPRLSADAIRAFLPARGGFTFPPPYDTQGVRLTNSDDGIVLPGYPYWRKINAHAGHPTLTVVVGRHDAPALMLSVDKETLAVEARPLEDLRGTGEQWYFSGTNPRRLYLTEGSRLIAYDVVTHARETVVEVDAGLLLWQFHSSDDGQTHAGTLKRQDTYGVTGVLVQRHGAQTVLPVSGAFDECQVDKSGRYLLIKEDGDNRIVDLETGEATAVADAEHAIGHSDNGFGYAVGEDDRHAQAGAFVLMMLDAPRRPARVVYHMHDWDAMSRYVSHGNARPGGPEGQWVLVSSAHRRDLPRANELVLAPLDGSLACVVVAPNLCDLDAPSGASDYEKLPMANLDPTGEWACFFANCGTDRLDAFLVRIPAENTVIGPARARV